MIRRLHEGDRASLMALLHVAPQMNLYILGNVEANGFEADFCEFFGDVEDGRVRGVVNRYMTGWTVFGEADADWPALGATVDAFPLVAERLQDNPGGVPSLLPYLQRYEAAAVSEEELMELPVGALRLQSAPQGFTVRKATKEDFDALVALFADAGSMARTPAAVERPLHDRRVWVAHVADHASEIVAAALTNAETTQLAMIGGVYTLPAWRGKQLSQAVVSGLCQEIIAQDKQPVLYWDNPAAGHVYQKIGFRRIGWWRSVRLAEK